jgi:zinc transport system substrate-binding protein
LQRSTRILRTLGILPFFCVVGITLASPPAIAETIVYTVNYPLAYFAERIGGDGVAVEFPAPEEIDPAFWKPGPEIIAAYQTADLILLNGAGFARWIGHASLPRRKLVDTSRSFRDDYLSGDEAPVHQHGPAGEHVHGEVAFTTWLDPRQAATQARAIEAALSLLRPEEAEGFAMRTDALVLDLERLDCEFAATLDALADEPILGSHPVYPYLARRYNLDLRSLVWEPELDPGEAGWRALDTMLAERPARWMLWEAKPLDSTRKKLAARGLGVIVIEVVGNRPAKGDYLSRMDANVEVLRQALAGDVPPLGRETPRRRLPSCERVKMPLRNGLAD